MTSTFAITFASGWDDIGYNFIVGEDGNVYEGRGWDIVGAHAGVNTYNQQSLGIIITLIVILVVLLSSSDVDGTDSGSYRSAIRSPSPNSLSQYLYCAGQCVNNI